MAVHRAGLFLPQALTGPFFYMRKNGNTMHTSTTTGTSGQFRIYFGSGQWLTGYNSPKFDGSDGIAVCVGHEKSARVYNRATACRVLRDVRRVMGGGWLIAAHA